MVPKRFLDKVTVNPDNGCWEWTAALNSSGVPVYSVERGNVRCAARYAWEVMNGDGPDGKNLKRSCACSLCVNPAHHTFKAVDYASRRVQKEGWDVGDCWGVHTPTPALRRALYKKHVAPNIDRQNGLVQQAGCSVAYCVNPYHQKVERVGYKWGKVNQKLTNKDVLEIRAAHAAGKPLAHLTKMYPVSYPTIWKIAHGQTWKHLL